ncbi:MAG: ABC transporter substrate-binding protein [Chloroflexota bacterium]
MLPVSRRRFLILSSSAVSLALLQACAQPAAAPAATATKAPAAASTPAATAAAPASAATAAATKAATQAPAAATKSGEPKRGGTLTMAKTGTMLEFNPFNMTPAHHAFTRALFNTLTLYDSKLQPQPELAEKWDLAADGKSITLKLRQGVKFHGGREFTADDVKYSLDYGQNGENVTMKPLFKAVQEIQTPDKYTVTLKFANPYPGVYDLLDMLYIVDKETFADHAKSAAGTGPFKLEKYTPNDRLDFLAHKDYWNKGRPYVDKYVIREIPDIPAMTINLESGAVDLIWQINYRDLVRLKESGKFGTDPGSKAGDMFNFGINTKVEPFTNKKVRQAIAWSIDRARFAKSTLQGLAEPTCLMWPKHSWAYFSDLESKVGYDLEKSRALLKEAGLEKGFEFELMTSSKNFGFLDIAQIIQADLKKIGVNVKIVDQEQAQFQTRIANKQIVTTIHSYGRTSRDPGSMMTGAKAWFNDKEGNWTRFESAEWDKLRADLNATVDLEKRKGTARKLQEMALDECFTNPMAPNLRAWAFGSYVKGFDYNLDYAPLVDGIWLDK